jgi:hypothetical protein
MALARKPAPDTAKGRHAALRRAQGLLSEHQRQTREAVARSLAASAAAADAAQIAVFSSAPTAKDG